MIRDFFADATHVTLAKSLDGLGIRHRVIANNIANVETPGFTRSSVRFEEMLKQELEWGGQRPLTQRIGGIQPEVVPDYVSPARPDGNNVSIDREMAELAKNNLRYEALVQLLNLKVSMVRSAIAEGRR